MRKKIKNASLLNLFGSAICRLATQTSTTWRRRSAKFGSARVQTVVSWAAACNVQRSLGKPVQVCWRLLAVIATPGWFSLCCSFHVVTHMCCHAKLLVNEYCAWSDNAEKASRVGTRLIYCHHSVIVTMTEALQKVMCDLTICLDCKFCHVTNYGRFAPLCQFPLDCSPPKTFRFWTLFATQCTIRPPP